MLNCCRETLICLIFFRLLFLGCITYGICSVLFLVLCTSHLIHVMPMMLYHFANSVLLSLLLVEKVVWLFYNYPKIWVQADSWGEILDCLSKFRLNFACCSILPHNWRWESLYMLHIPAMKWFLKVWIVLYALFGLWLLGGTNWYLMFIIVIFILNADDASLSMQQILDLFLVF